MHNRPHDPHIGPTPLLLWLFHKFPPPAADPPISSRMVDVLYESPDLMMMVAMLEAARLRWGARVALDCFIEKEIVVYRVSVMRLGLDFRDPQIASADQPVKARSWVPGFLDAYAQAQKHRSPVPVIVEPVRESWWWRTLRRIAGKAASDET